MHTVYFYITLLKMSERLTENRKTAGDGSSAASFHLATIKGTLQSRHRTWIFFVALKEFLRQGHYTSWYCLALLPTEAGRADKLLLFPPENSL